MSDDTITVSKRELDAVVLATRRERAKSTIMAVVAAGALVVAVLALVAIFKVDNATDALLSVGHRQECRATVSAAFDRAEAAWLDRVAEVGVANAGDELERLVTIAELRGAGDPCQAADRLPHTPAGTLQVTP